MDSISSSVDIWHIFRNVRLRSYQDTKYVILARMIEIWLSWFILGNSWFHEVKLFIDIPFPFSISHNSFAFEFEKGIEEKYLCYRFWYIILVHQIVRFSIKWKKWFSRLNSNPVTVIWDSIWYSLYFRIKAFDQVSTDWFQVIVHTKSVSKKQIMIFTENQFCLNVLDESILRDFFYANILFVKSKKKRSHTYDPLISLIRLRLFHHRFSIIQYLSLRFL